LGKIEKKEGQYVVEVVGGGGDSLRGGTKKGNGEIHAGAKQSAIEMRPGLVGGEAN